MITRGDSIGGAQIHVRDLARRLSADGVAVHVATGAAGPLTETLAADGIPVTIVPGLLREIHPVRDAQAIAALRGAMRGFAPDLVSTHSSKAGIAGRIAARWAGAPSLFTAHGWAFTEGVPEPRRRIYRTMEQGAAPLSARIVCVSAHDRRLGVACGIRGDRLVTIRNGMPDIPESLRARPGRGTGGAGLRLVMTARFDRQKDHRTMLLALREVEGARIDFVGDGPDQRAVADLAETLGVADRVSFLGRRSDVAEILAGAQAFVLSSHWEGFPRSTLEAMRAGLPTVVSDVGGAAEAVTEGGTGFIVPRGDVGALALALRRLSADPALRDRLGTAARARYEAEFTFERMYAETIRVYEEVRRRATTGRA